MYCFVGKGSLSTINGHIVARLFFSRLVAFAGGKA
jgi:hypothetical protein